jgi:hypothetical protein
MYIANKDTEDDYYYRVEYPLIAKDQEAVKFAWSW